VSYRLGSRRTGSLVWLVVANETYVAPLGADLQRRYLELEYASTASATCLGAAPPVAVNGSAGAGVPGAREEWPPAVAAIDPAVVSPRASPSGAGAAAPWAPGAAAAPSSGSRAALAAARAAMGEAEWAARGCEAWVSAALYDVKWKHQARRRLLRC
jgi:hypothetical protein